MKLKAFLILSHIFLASCNHKNIQSKQECQQYFVFNNSVEFKPAVIERIKRYSSYLQKDSVGVVVLSFSNNEQEETYTMFSLITSDFIKKHPCINYFEIDNIPVLVYTGIEKYILKTHDAVNCIPEKINDRLIDDSAIKEKSISYNSLLVQFEVKNDSIIDKIIEKHPLFKHL